MIIDFHTHTFPEKMAPATIAKLSASANVKNYVAGTVADLQTSTKKAGIDYSVIQPVVTNPRHEPTVNRVAIEINEQYENTGILSFGGIHPENENYKEILHSLKNNGIKGIKLHPVFQETYFDDIRYKRIIDCAMELDLVVLSHAGFDISFPGQDYVTPKQILPVIKELAPHKLVLAHMGSWNFWDEVLSDIAGADVYFDTSFSLSPLRSPKDGTTTKQKLSVEQFRELVRKHGANRILFGSDSPWSDQGESIEIFKSTGLSQDELDLLLGENARELLKL